jgi:hypothetical protein
MSGDWRKAHDPKPAKCAEKHPTEGGRCERKHGHAGPHAYDPWDDWGPRYWTSEVKP